MKIARKRLVISLITILLLCAACSSGAINQESAIPESPVSLPTANQTPETAKPPVAEQAPDAAKPQETASERPTSSPQQESGETVSETAAATEPATTPGDETGALSESPQPGGPSGQADQSPATPQESEGSATNQNGPQPTETNDPPSAPPDDEPVILTIYGDAVDSETTWTLARLQTLREGYRELTYSTTNNWPSFGSSSAHGVSLPYLLRQAGLKSSAASVTFISTDGYHKTLTYDQVFGTRYSYSNHSASGSSGAFPVESVLAWEWGEAGKIRPENLCPFFGHSGPLEVNSASFVKDLYKIEVSAASAGTWAAPGASVADGVTVPDGAQFDFLYDNMDNIRIYYTLDGSEPDYNSAVYNPSASYFQPQLTKPLVLTESVTIKAFAAGFGKDKSVTVTFNITVE